MGAVIELTPAEMLQRGVFGRNYFANATEQDFLGMSEEVTELALDNAQPYDKNLNFYSARAGESYDAWKKNGWIFPEDPLGWFHWYCRYHNGRIHERDWHQMNRYTAYRKRWGLFARNQVHTKGFASNVVKQGLLQWGIEPMRILEGC